MASTYTTNIRLTKQGDGDNANSWGQVLNDGVISLTDQAIAGISTVSIGSAASVVLTANDGATDQSRNAFLKVTGTVGGSHDTINIIIPNKSKSYAILNAVSANDSTDAVVMKVEGSVGVTLGRSSTKFQYVVCDGGSVRAANLLPTNISVGGTLDVTGNTSIGGTLITTGAATFDDDVSVSGNVNIGGTATVAGAVQLNSTVTVEGATVIKGATRFASNVSVEGNLDINGNLTGPPIGKVLQTLQTFTNTVQTISGTSFTDITNMSQAITPSATTSKVLITVFVNFSADSDTFPAFKLLRDSTWIGKSTTLTTGQETTFSSGVQAGGAGVPTQMSGVSYTFLDSPSTTSAVTYKLQVSPMRTYSRTIEINQAVTRNDNNQCSGTSTITVQEIGA
tara:strand:+ start:96 stop:1280 length:1185 start_codon:yes stop_codon:yes gene_type:complete